MTRKLRKSITITTLVVLLVGVSIGSIGLIAGAADGDAIEGTDEAERQVGSTGEEIAEEDRTEDREGDSPSSEEAIDATPEEESTEPADGNGETDGGEVTNGEDEEATSDESDTIRLENTDSEPEPEDDTEEVDTEDNAEFESVDEDDTEPDESTENTGNEEEDVAEPDESSDNEEEMESDESGEKNTVPEEITHSASGIDDSDGETAEEQEGTGSGEIAAEQTDPVDATDEEADNGETDANNVGQSDESVESDDEPVIAEETESVDETADEETDESWDADVPNGIDEELDGEVSTETDTEPSEDEIGQDTEETNPDLSRTAELEADTSGTDDASIADDNSTTNDSADVHLETATNEPTDSTPDTDSSADDDSTTGEEITGNISDHSYRNMTRNGETENQTVNSAILDSPTDDDAPSSEFGVRNLSNAHSADSVLLENQSNTAPVENASSVLSGDSTSSVTSDSSEVAANVTNLKTRGSNETESRIVDDTSNTTDSTVDGSLESLDSVETELGNDSNATEFVTNPNESTDPLGDAASNIGNESVEIERIDETTLGSIVLAEHDGWVDEHDIDEETVELVTDEEIVDLDTLSGDGTDDPSLEKPVSIIQSIESSTESTTTTDDFDTTGAAVNDSDDEPILAVQTSDAVVSNDLLFVGETTESDLDEERLEIVVVAETTNTLEGTQVVSEVRLLESDDTLELTNGSTDTLSTLVHESTDTVVKLVAVADDESLITTSDDSTQLLENTDATDTITGLLDDGTVTLSTPSTDRELSVGEVSPLELTGDDQLLVVDERVGTVASDETTFDPSASRVQSIDDGIELSSVANILVVDASSDTLSADDIADTDPQLRELVDESSASVDGSNSSNTGLLSPQDTPADSQLSAVRLSESPAEYSVGRMNSSSISNDTPSKTTDRAERSGTETTASGWTADETILSAGAETTGDPLGTTSPTTDDTDASQGVGGTTNTSLESPSDSTPSDGDGDSGSPIPDRSNGTLLIALAAGIGFVGRRVISGAGFTAAMGSNMFRLQAHTLWYRVREWLRSLPRIFPIPGYSRYDDTDPLENERRSRLYELIAREPGVHLSQLVNDTGISRSSVRYHLRVLEHENVVTPAKIRGKRRFYPIETDDIELAAVFQDDSMVRVLNSLAETEPATVSKLAEALDRDPSTVTHHLKRLEDAGAIDRERDGRSVLNRLTPESRRLLTTARETTADLPVPESSAD